MSDGAGAGKSGYITLSLKRIELLEKRRHMHDDARSNQSDARRVYQAFRADSSERQSSLPKLASQETKEADAYR